MSPDHPLYCQSIQRAADDAVREVMGSAIKFPLNRHMHAALGEEVGEVANALLEHDRGHKTSLEVYTEAMQAAAMCIRIAIEGSEEFAYQYDSFDARQFRPTSMVQRLPLRPVEQVHDVGC